ncbi:MAG: C40 family peptidase [Saprospiraceae bacterium]|nr:C40 family peptidase [Saprospiraceae bacterium]
MKNPAICQLSAVPVRAAASDKEEIVTQLLFGELVDIIEFGGRTKRNWCQIRCDWDGYEGWMDVRQLRFISLGEAENYHKNLAFCLDLTAILTNNDHFLPITLGATLPNFDGINVHLGDKHYAFNGQALQNGYRAPTAEFIVKLARRYLYAPYLWGGRSPFGIDCSGFTQTVFRMAGIRLRRDASQQVEQGRLVDFIEQAQAADLAFFENPKGNIVHVGIVLDNQNVIHAAGQVRIDKLDHFGIFNEERGIYSHKLRLIKRFLPDLPKIKTPSVSVEELTEVDENQISMF